MEETIISFLREPILAHFSVYNVSVYDLSVFMFCLSFMPIIIRTPLQRLSQAEFGETEQLKTGTLDRNIGDRKMEMTYTNEIICGLPGEVLWNFQTI